MSAPMTSTDRWQKSLCRRHNLNLWRTVDRCRRRRSRHTPQLPHEPTMLATSGNARMRQQHDWCLHPIDTTSLPVAAAASSERRPLRGWQSMTQSCPRNFLRATARMSCKRFSTPVDQFNWFAFAAGAGDIRAYEAVFPSADMPETAALRISKP